jgi:hypothetical protein
LIPRRLERFIVGALTGLLGFALVAVPLAMLGVFRPLPVGIATAVAWFGLWKLWGRGPHTEQDAAVSTRGKQATAIALLAILVLTALNFRYSSQHLLTERDPGVYNTTAGSIARTGGIVIEPESDAYRGVRSEERIRYEAAGYWRDPDDGKMYPQFVHLFPTTLAASSWIVGVRGMLKVNALFGGLALLVFFAFCARLSPVWAAVGATIALGANLAQVNFTRDSYTEVLTQILLFGGLWALMSARSSRNWRRGLIAGLLLGAACMARADAFVFLVPLAAYVVYELVAQDRSARSLRTYLGALAGGAALPTVLAAIDLRVFSPAYLEDNWKPLRFGFVALVAVIVGGAAYIVLRPRLSGIREWLFRNRSLIAATAAVALVFIAVLGYYIRPHIQSTYGDKPSAVVEAVQMQEGLVVEGNRTYSERSLEWLGLYLGPLALWAGIGGLATMTREILLGQSRRAVPFLLAMMPMTAYYVWDPGITPDHVWAMRRFLPITIPGLIFCCFWLLGRIWRATGRGRNGSIARAVVVGAALWAVLFPVWTLQPFIRERSQVGVLNATDRLCAHLPDDAAVIVAQTQNLDQNYIQTVRSFCEVPVASAPMDQPLDFYAELAARWAARGRVLYVVAPQMHFGTFWPATSTQIASTRYRNIEKTLQGRPDGFESYEFALFVRRIEPAG